MKEPFNVPKPIEELFKQIEDATDFANAAGAPSNNSQELSRAYILVHRTGEYNDACRDWRKKTENEKTWETFKHNFTTAHRDMLANKLLQPNPYQQANAVIKQFQERMDAILEHVANSTVDTSTISILTTQNETLQSQLANATRDLLSMKQLVETLCKPRKHGICATDILAHYNVARSNLFFHSNYFYIYTILNFKYSNCKNLRAVNSYLNETTNY